MRVVNGSYRRSVAAATGSRLLAGSGYLHHHVRTVRILRGLYLLRNISMLSLHYRATGHDNRMPSLRRLPCLRRVDATTASPTAAASTATTTSTVAFSTPSLPSIIVRNDFSCGDLGGRT